MINYLPFAKQYMKFLNENMSLKDTFCIYKKFIHKLEKVTFKIKKMYKYALVIK